MNKLNLIHQLLNDIETMPLSKSVPSVLPIALECMDYIGYCVLSCLLNPVSDNPQTNTIRTNEIMRVLFLQGLSSEEVAKITQKSMNEFIELKTIAKDQVCSHSIKEIELWLPEAKAILDSPTNTTRESYQDLSIRIAQTRRLYEVLRGYVVSKLTYYQQAIKLFENKEKKAIKNPEITSSANSNKVFIVHGHNAAVKEAVARLIEKQGIQAIILHEQANQGDTIIEKFERNSDVGCAICLFTGDDIGRAKNTANDSVRARQNVVFEAGYFIGKLGRDKTIIVSDRGVEIPSDLQGVVYTDTTDWRLGILQELKARGYSVDYNKLD